MTRQERKDQVFRRALLALNIDYNKLMEEKRRYDSLDDKRGATDPGIPIEVQYCEEFFNSAVSFCSSVRPWSFLMNHVYYGEQEGVDESPYGERLTWTETVDGETKTHNTEYKSHKYGYEKPTDMLYPYLVDGSYNEDFAVDADNIYFKHPVRRLDYIHAEFNQMANVPEPFLNLISARLAIEIAPMIAPDANVSQRASAQFQLLLTSLNTIEANLARKRNPKPLEYVL